MQTVPVKTILNKQIDQAFGHLIYVVRDQTVVFYVGQSKRDVVERFWEHLHKPSRLGQLIQQNEPDSHNWQVDFYTLADCRPFVSQKSLFAMQAWEAFDMDMAEEALIRQLKPILNRDFNAKPSLLPQRYRGQELAATPQFDLHAPQNRVWLNRMSLAGWVYEETEDGQLIWHHPNGRFLPDAAVQPYRRANQLPPTG